jgi:hypothetical protein
MTRFAGACYGPLHLRDLTQGCPSTRSTTSIVNPLFSVTLQRSTSTTAGIVAEKPRCSDYADDSKTSLVQIPKVLEYDMLQPVAQRVVINTPIEVPTSES